MEDMDDDFGDLYADVEAQASSAINDGRDFTRFYTEDDDSDSDGNKMNANHSSEDNNGSSDSEDDLNIVLNDEDCEGKSFPVVEQLDAKNEDDEDGFVVIKDEEVKYIRTRRPSIPSDVKANGSTSVLARCEWNYKVHGRQKGQCSGQNDLVGTARNSVMTQSRPGFSLQWYRSILDVNIDSFKEKPWRYHGVDTTDFFNFGFNEESWRQYCNSMEQLRSQAFMRLGNSNHMSQNQAYEGGSMYDERVQDTMNDNVDQRKGRAIQVEDGDGERQPSVNLRHPRDRDSNVVIQITLEDPIEDTSDTVEKRDRSGGTPFETSNNKEANATNDRDVCPSRGGRGNEFSVESLDEDEKKADRCSAKTTASEPMINDPDDTENNQSLDVDGNHQEETRTFSSDGTMEVLEIVNKSVVSNSCCEDRGIAETELSLEKEDKLSLTSSCFESDSEASRDDSLDHGKVTSPIRRSSVKSGVELWDSETSHHKDLKRNYKKINPVDFRDYSKYRTPVKGKRKHRARSVDSPAQRKIAVYDIDTSRGLDTEDIYDKSHLSAYYGRWKDKLEDFDLTEREDFAFYERSKQSHCCGSRESARDHIHIARKNYRNGNQDFDDMRSPYLIDNWRERGYLCEDERREGYRYRQGPFIRDMPVAYKETGQLVSRYSATNKEMDFQTERKNNKLLFGKQTNHRSQFPDYELDDAHFTQERNARSFSLNNRKRDTLDTSYKRQVPKSHREVKNSGWKRYKDASLLESEGAWSREIEDEYWWNTDVHYLSRHSHRESDEERWSELHGSWSGKTENEYWGNTNVRQSYREFEGERWTEPISPRIGVSRSRFIERFRRQVPVGQGRECGWFENHNDSQKFEDRFIYTDDEVHPRRMRRRHGWKSEVLPWTKEGPTNRHRDEKLNFKKSSFFCKEDVRQRRNQSTHRSFHDAMHIDIMQADENSFAMMRDGSNTHCIYRKRKMFRAKNEQAFLRCQDSVDLFVGEGKLSRRQPTNRNLSCNSRFEDRDLENFVESPRYKTVQPQSNLPKFGLNHSSEAMHDQFPRSAQNEDFDIEEGQIVTEEPGMGDSISAACTHNPKKRTMEVNPTPHGGKTGGACDDQRILETLAKMERRRERFKEPITFKREQEKCTKPSIAPSAIAETMQHRPARKRQWCTVQESQMAR